MKTVKYYESVFEAEVAKGLLGSEGITAIVQNDNLASVLPHLLANSSILPYIVVADEDYERAKEIIYGAGYTGCEKMTCPECGSDEIAFGFGGGKSKRKRIIRYTLLPLAFVASVAGKVSREYYCKKCRYEFKKTC